MKKALLIGSFISALLPASVIACGNKKTPAVNQTVFNWQWNNQNPSKTTQLWYEASESLDANFKYSSTALQTLATKINKILTDEGSHRDLSGITIKASNGIVKHILLPSISVNDLISSIGAIIFK